MPGDPAVFEEAKNVPAFLSAANLLAAIALKLPPFWPNNIETWLIQSNRSSPLKELPADQV